MQGIILVDNGSRRAEAVLNLNRLARQLSEKSGMPIDAVPLQHADKIPSEEFGDALGGKPVLTFPDYIARALACGVDKVAISMLFISPGRHAGEGGDIAGICNQAMQRHPGLAVHVSPLVGDSL